MRSVGSVFDYSQVAIEKWTPIRANPHNWSSNMYFKTNAMNHNLSDASWSQRHRIGKETFMTGLETLISSIFPLHTKINFMHEITCVNSYLSRFSSHDKRFETNWSTSISRHLNQNNLRVVTTGSYLSGYLPFPFHTCPSAQQQMITTLCFACLMWGWLSQVLLGHISPETVDKVEYETRILLFFLYQHFPEDVIIKLTPGWFQITGSILDPVPQLANVLTLIHSWSNPLSYHAYCRWQAFKCVALKWQTSQSRLDQLYLVNS